MSTQLRPSLTRVLCAVSNYRHLPPPPVELASTSSSWPTEEELKWQLAGTHSPFFVLPSTVGNKNCVKPQLATEWGSSAIWSSLEARVQAARCNTLLLSDERRGNSRTKEWEITHIHTHTHTQQLKRKLQNCLCSISLEELVWLPQSSNCAQYLCSTYYALRRIESIQVHLRSP